MGTPIDTTGTDVRVELPASDVALADWDSLFRSSPYATPFASRLFVEAVSRTLEARVAFFGSYSGSVLTAAALLPTKRLGWRTRAIVTPFTPFSAILTAQAVPESSVHGGSGPLDALIRAIGNGNAVAHAHLPPAMRDARPFEWQSWKTSPLYTYRVDLTTPGEVWKKWSGGTRRTFLNNREKYQVQERAGNDDDLARLCVDGYRRNGRRPPLERDRITELVGALRGGGLVKTFFATDTETTSISAALAVLGDSMSAYYWVAGSRPGPAMTVLVGEVLDRIRGQGVRVFDFMGANTPGIAEFKRRFGADLTTYYRAEWSRGVLARFHNLLR